jgi:demethylmenaquinone methyltransferase/2-methoxy-6-polyprenyl-1,4-benzoquinol methylase
MSDSQTVVVDKSGDKVQQMFAEIAPKYDLMNHLLSLNVDRWWRHRTVRRLAPTAEQRVLDVCTGTGDLAIALWRRMQAGAPRRDGDPAAPPPEIWTSDEVAGQDLGRYQVVASDFCRPMLELGVQKSLRRGCHSLRFVEADAMQLPFADQQFDLVTVAFGLRNVAQTEVGLREMVRVCAAGGQVGILEFTMPRLWPLSALYRFYFLRLLPRIGQFFAKNRSAAYNYLPESVGQFPQYEQLAAMMQQAGLQDVRFHPMTMGLATLYVGRKP